MAHYAFLDENNIVTEVIVGKDEGEDNIDWEQWYGEFRGQTCKRTSYNTWKGEHRFGGTPFRKNYAGMGWTYNAEIDGFVPPHPGYASWTLNATTGHWDPPIPYPDDGKDYTWNETEQKWDEFIFPTEG